MKEAEYNMSSKLGLLVEKYGTLWERTGRENWKYVDLFIEHVFLYFYLWQWYNVPAMVI